jgi:hypothetical protein
MDSLALSKAPDATNTVQALLLLRRLGDQPGSALRDALGESLTAEEALARLADGSEVVARVPAQGTARSTSALLFSIDDVHALGARLANT